MKCPNKECDHEFDIDDFGEYCEKTLTCPKCKSNVQALMDYMYIPETGDEWPCITELEIVDNQ